MAETNEHQTQNFVHLGTKWLDAIFTSSQTRHGYFMIVGRLGEVKASQVGGHFAGKYLYATSVAHLTENVIVERVAAAAVRVRR